MTALVQLRPQSRDLGVLMMDDEDLAIDLVGLRNEITDDDDSFLPPLEQPRTVDNEWLMAEYDPSVLSSVENKELLQVVISEPSDSTSEEPAASPPPSKPKSSSSSSSSRPSMHTVIRRQTPPPSKTKPSTPSSRSTLPSLSKPKPYRTAAWKPLPSSRSSTPARKAAPTAACKNPMPSSSSKPLSESRGRPRSSTNSTFSSPDSSNGKPLRRKSCPHAKPRSPSIGNKTRGHGNDAEVSPVVMGTKMVERVVNMRKLVAPPKQADERAEDDDDKRPNKVSARKDKGSSGFGRSLSSKSLDMAIRHMDIRKSIPENLRPVETSCVKPRTAAKSCDVTESSPSPPSSLWSGNDISKYCV